MSIRKAKLGHADFVNLSRDLLTCGYGIRFRAKGWSMMPTIREGDILTLMPVIHSNIRRGDIVLACLKRGLIAHRVATIKRGNEGDVRLGLQGDSADGPMEVATLDEVLGKVVAVERNGRQIGMSGRVARIMQKTNVRLFRLKNKIREHIKGGAR